MTGLKYNKLQKLLADWPADTIATSSWLESIGISKQLIQSYKKHGWVESFGSGAFRKPQDLINCYGAVYALQTQLDLKIHIGAKTALDLQGLAHYIPMGRSTIDLLKTPDTSIPKWFSIYPWEERVRLINSIILPADIGLDDFTIGKINVKISSRERAALEILALTPRLYDFDEVKIIMESLASLRSELLTDLLEKCTSEKVKRLILYFGEVQNHPWRKRLNEEKIKTNKYILKITNSKGHYNAKYNLFLPNEYIIREEQNVRF